MVSTPPGQTYALVNRPSYFLTMFSPSWLRRMLAGGCAPPGAACALPPARAGAAPPMPPGTVMVSPG